MSICYFCCQPVETSVARYCNCTDPIHTKCYQALIKNGFRRCTICRVPYPCDYIDYIIDDVLWCVIYLFGAVTAILWFGLVHPIFYAAAIAGFYFLVNSAIHNWKVFNIESTERNYDSVSFG